MDLSKAEFRYSTVMKALPTFKFDLTELFPHASEISLASRTFGTYTECVTSCKSLLEDLVKTINEGEGPKFKVGAETNPKLSGQATLSKDWVESEVARFWVFDKAMEGNGSRIDALARSSIYADPKAPDQRVLS